MHRLWGVDGTVITRSSREAFFSGSNAPQPKTQSQTQPQTQPLAPGATCRLQSNVPVGERCAEGYACLSADNNAPLGKCMRVLPVGKMGCLTPHFVCAAGSACENDVCVQRTARVFTVAKEPKEYMSHDGTRWLSGLGQACDSGKTACHPGMDCADGTCRAVVGPAGGKYDSLASQDCRKPFRTCAPEYACATSDGKCQPSTDKAGERIKFTYA